MQVMTDPTHPVMAGMPERADVFVSNSPVFTTLDGFEGTVLAKFATDSTPLRSGFLQRAAVHAGLRRGARREARARDTSCCSRFQPQWRGQPTGTFRTVFNAAFFRARRRGSGEGERRLLDGAAAASARR